MPNIGGKTKIKNTRRINDIGQHTQIIYTKELNVGAVENFMQEKRGDKMKSQCIALRHVLNINFMLRYSNYVCCCFFLCLLFVRYIIILMATKNRGRPQKNNNNIIINDINVEYVSTKTGKFDNSIVYFKLTDPKSEGKQCLDTQANDKDVK